jgi:hypothetical protein
LIAAPSDNCEVIAFESGISDDWSLVFAWEVTGSAIAKQTQNLKIRVFKLLTADIRGISIKIDLNNRQQLKCHY